MDKSDILQSSQDTLYIFKKKMTQKTNIWIDKNVLPVTACWQDKVVEVWLGGLAGVWVLQKAEICFWGPEKQKILMVVKEPAFASAQISWEVEC